MESKKTGTVNIHFCNLCASGGWGKQVSLSQHKRHMYKSEYNATVDVPLKKRRWTNDEMLILVELEMDLPSTKGLNINSALARKFPCR